MLNNVQVQLLKPLSLTKPQNNGEPLWKRVQPYLAKQQNQSTQRSFNATVQKSQSQIMQNITAQKSKDQPNINGFLLKMHHRISQSAYGSQSEIVQKLSLDWEEQQSHRIMGGSVAKKFTINDTTTPIFLTPRTEKALNIPTALQSLKYIKNLQAFINYIETINPKLYTQLSKIMQDNIQLTQQCLGLKYKQNKAQIKIKMLDNQVQILERKNNQLIADFQKLRNQVQKQIQLQEDKYKYKYQKKIQQMKEDFEKKMLELQKKMETSTNNTKSIISQTKESDLKDMFCQVQNGTKCEAIKKKGQLVRSNRKSSFKQENNDQKCNEMNPKLVRQHKKQSQFDLIIGQIVRPFVTKSLSLANSNSN